MEPPVKRAYAFFDGQNLFRSVKESFGYIYPNYDPAKLAALVCRQKEWELKQVYFYTGVPDVSDDPHWNQFWRKKIAYMGKQGIKTFSRPLRYRNQRRKLPDGNEVPVLVAQEKGIDIRIALDVVRFAREQVYDVSILFSQDQDFSEVAQEIRAISDLQDRWIKILSAFPSSPTSRNKRGIDKTDWLPLDRATYDACIDSNRYTEKKA